MLNYRCLWTLLLVLIRSIREMNLEGNQLTSLPAPMLRLRHLRHLGVRNNYMHPLFWRENSKNTAQVRVNHSGLGDSPCRRTAMTPMYIHKHIVGEDRYFHSSWLVCGRVRFWNIGKSKKSNTSVSVHHMMNLLIFYPIERHTSAHL